MAAGGQTSNSLMSGSMAKEDPFGSFMSGLGGAGINAFGPLGYNDWLQNDAFGMVDAMYGMAIQSNPKLTRDAFHKSIFSDPRAAQMFGPESYRSTNAQENPRDFYNSQLQASGVNMTGVSPYERWMRGEGYDQAATAYGTAHQRDPRLMWSQYVNPNSFAR